MEVIPSMPDSSGKLTGRSKTRFFCVTILSLYCIWITFPVFFSITSISSPTKVIAVGYSNA